MKDQRLSRIVLRGIVLIAVLMMSSALWADTVLAQFPPPGSTTGMTVTVTPGVDPSQVSAVRNGIQELQINGNAAWIAAGSPEIGLVFLADINGIHTASIDPIGNITDRSDYTVGFTAPGSNDITYALEVQVISSSDTGFFGFTIRAVGGGVGFGSCDQFIDSAGNNGQGGECFAFADGQVHDLGLITGVDNLEIQTPAPDASVPEPSSLLLLGTGLASGLAGLRRKRVTTN